MPRETRALTRARAADRGLLYQQARAEVIEIHARAESDDMSFAEAQAVYDDPLNRSLCDRCHWTVGMTCPECDGCGCDRRCIGWRHHEYMHEDDRADRNACPECGGDTTTGYDCRCDE
ncbi:MULTISPECIES: hypothetical protein [Nocardia]|uniref:hypothetical protein n=1 Tax=Nocardia TaxID=1817 RepID=UPI000D69EA7A|nr:MULTISPECIES: hypothetical protein [Nocardia]